MLFFSSGPVRAISIGSRHPSRIDDYVSGILFARDTGDDAKNSVDNVSGRKTPLIAACVTSSVLVLLLLLLLLWFYQRRRRTTPSLPRTSADGLLRQDIEKGENSWRRPSYGSPPPRSELSQWMHAAPQHQPQVRSYSPPQSSPRVVEVDYNPYREPSWGEHGPTWTSAPQGTPRLRYVPAHPVPPPSPVILPASFTGLHSRSQSNTRDVGQSVAAVHTVDPPTQQIGPSLTIETLESNPTFETRSQSRFQGLEPVGAIEAPALVIPSSASTRWPRFGFSSGVPDEYAASPHTATTNASWRRSFYVPWRQRTISGPRDRGGAARDAKRQHTLSLPQSDSAPPTSASAAHVCPETLLGGAEDDVRVPASDQLNIHEAPSTPQLSPSRPSLKVNTNLPPAPVFLSERPVPPQKRIKRKPVSALLKLKSKTAPSGGAKLVVQNATST